MLYSYTTEISLLQYPTFMQLLNYIPHSLLPCMTYTHTLMQLTHVKTPTPSAHIYVTGYMGRLTTHVHHKLFTCVISFTRRCIIELILIAKDTLLLCTTKTSHFQYHTFMQLFEYTPYCLEPD